MEVYGSTESLGPQMQGLHAPGTNRVGSVGRVAAGLAEGKVASWHGDSLCDTHYMIHAIIRHVAAVQC